MFLENKLTYYNNSSMNPSLLNQNRKLNNYKKRKRKCKKQVVHGSKLGSVDCNKQSYIPHSAHAFSSNYMQNEQRKKCEYELVSEFTRGRSSNLNSYLSDKERKCIKQFSTPDILNRLSPPHLYNRKKGSSSGIEHNFGFSNCNINKKSKIASEVANSKLSKLNKIIQNEKKENCYNNDSVLQYQKPASCLPQVLNDSISSYEEKRGNKEGEYFTPPCERNQNNDKLIILGKSKVLEEVKSHLKNQEKARCVANKYADNEVLKEYLHGETQSSISALSKMESNLKEYFYNNRTLSNKSETIGSSKKESNDARFIASKRFSESYEISLKQVLNRKYRRKLGVCKEREIRTYLETERHTLTSNIISIINSVFESTLQFRDQEIQNLLVQSQKNTEQYSNECDKSNSNQRNTGYSTAKKNKKIKVLKNSRIEYAKEHPNAAIPDSINANTDERIEKSSETVRSPKERITNLKSNSKSEKTPLNCSLYNNAKDAMDEEIEVSYNQNYNSPDGNDNRALLVLSRQSISTNQNCENEARVPPLALKNIKSGKNTHGNNTGKLTRTTMNTTQIRDKISSSNIKCNTNSAVFQQNSNTDSNNKVISEEVEVPKIDEIILDSKSSSSGYDYPLDYDMQVEPQKPKLHPFVPMLNLGSKVQTKQDSYEAINEQKPVFAIPQIPIKKVPNLGLNLNQVKVKDFHEEFMEKFDEYSESWREMMKKQQRY